MVVAVTWTLDMHDTIQLRDRYAVNPLTQHRTDMLQYYVLTRRQTGAIDPAALWPVLRESEPIPLSEIVRLNGCPVRQ